MIIGYLPLSGDCPFSWRLLLWTWRWVLGYSLMGRWLDVDLILRSRWLMVDVEFILKRRGLLGNNGDFCFTWRFFNTELTLAYGWRWLHIKKTLTICYLPLSGDYPFTLRLSLWTWRWLIGYLPRSRLLDVVLILSWRLLMVYIDFILKPRWINGLLLALRWINVQLMLFTYHSLTFSLRWPNVDLTVVEDYFESSPNLDIEVFLIPSLFGSFQNVSLLGTLQSPTSSNHLPSLAVKSPHIHPT